MGVAGAMAVPLALARRLACDAERFALWGVLSLTVAYAFASLWLPFGWDHGIMMSVGSTIADGGLPYRDAWDVKGPFAYVPFALSSLYFGPVMWGIRLIELVLLFPAVFVVWRLIAARISDSLGAWTALALYLWLASAGWFFTAQPDLWVTAASVIAICPYLMPNMPKHPLTIAAVGILIGCTGLVKPIYLAFGAVPLIALATAPGFTLSRLARQAAWLAVGAALPILAAVAYLAVRGGLSEAINVHLVYVASTYANSQVLRHFAEGTVEFLAQPAVGILMPFVVLGLWSRKSDTPLLAPLAGWLALSLIFVILQGKAYAYHWFVVYPPFIILAAHGLDALWRSAPASSYPRIIAVVMGIVLFANISFLPAREIVRLGKLLTGLESAEEHYAKYEFRNYIAADQIKAARFLKEHTAPDDQVFVWGVDATVSFLSGRANPTRFVFNMPLSMESPFRAEYRDETIRKLNAAPPAFIVVGSPWEWEKETALAKFPELEAFLKQGYALETSIGNLDLYRRRALELGGARGTGLNAGLHTKLVGSPKG
jgi:hypothetical protein